MSDRATELYNEFLDAVEADNGGPEARRAYRREHGPEMAEAIYTDAAFLRACKRIAELEGEIRKAEEDRDLLLALLCDCRDFLRSRAPIGSKLRRDIEETLDAWRDLTKRGMSSPTAAGMSPASPAGMPSASSDTTGSH